mgnify:CR=1 FL=1
MARHALFLEDRFAAEGVARQFEDGLIVGKDLGPVGGRGLEERRRPLLDRRVAMILQAGLPDRIDLGSF